MRSPRPCQVVDFLNEIDEVIGRQLLGVDLFRLIVPQFFQTDCARRLLWRGGYKLCLVRVAEFEPLIGRGLICLMFHRTVLAPSHCGTAAGGRPVSFSGSAIKALHGSGTPIHTRCYNLSA